MIAIGVDIVRMVVARFVVLVFTLLVVALAFLRLLAAVVATVGIPKMRVS